MLQFLGNLLICYILPDSLNFFYFEPRWGFPCHLFTSVLSRLDKLGRTYFDHGKKLAAKLISTVILESVSLNEAILAKLETFILRLTESRRCSQATDDYSKNRPNSMRKLAGKGWWNMAEAIADT